MEEKIREQIRYVCEGVWGRFKIVGGQKGKSKKVGKRCQSENQSERYLTVCVHYKKALPSLSSLSPFNVSPL